MSVKAKLEARLQDAANAATTIRKRKGFEDEEVYKVLDVSKMLDDGEGTVIHARPLTEKGAKKPPLGGLDIISDNYGTYAVAVKALGRPELAEEWARKYGRGQATPEGRKSPKKVAATFEENLAAAVNKIIADNKGFLLDVSNLGPLKSGKMGGFRSTNPIDVKTGKERFGADYTGGKVGIDTDEIPIISNNYENYAIAVRAIDRDDLAERFADKFGSSYNKKVVRGSSPGKTGATSPGRKRDSTPTEKLVDMYNSLAEPKMQKDVNGDEFVVRQANTGELDVSDLKEDGTGSRVVYRARKGATGANVTKKGIDGLDIISNNYKTYKLAMELLAKSGNRDFLDFPPAYLEAYGQGVGKKSPVRGGAKKEAKVKGKPISKTGSRSASSSSSSRSRSVSPVRTVVPRRTVAPRTGRVSPTRTGRTSPTRTGRTSPTRTVVPRTVVPRTGRASPTRTVVPRTQRSRSTSAERAQNIENLRNLSRSRSGSRSSGSRSGDLFVIPENSDI